MRPSSPLTASRMIRGLAVMSICLLLMNCVHPSRAATASATTNDKKPTAAEAAWQAVLDASEPLDPPNSWAKQEPTQKAVARFHLGAAKAAARAAAKARQFYSRYPDHPKAFRARVKECELR